MTRVLDSLACGKLNVQRQQCPSQHPEEMPWPTERGSSKRCDADFEFVGADVERAEEIYHDDAVLEFPQSESGLKASPHSRSGAGNIPSTRHRCGTAGDGSRCSTWPLSSCRPATTTALRGCRVSSCWNFAMTQRRRGKRDFAGWTAGRLRVRAPWARQRRRGRSSAGGDQHVESERIQLQLTCLRAGRAPSP